MVKEPENTVSLGLEYFCDEGDDFWNMPEEECIALASDAAGQNRCYRPRSIKRAPRES